MPISLGGIKTGKTAAGKKELLALPVDDEIQEMADELARLDEQEKSAKAGKEQIQARFKELVRPFLFDTNHGKATIQATVSVQGKSTEILVALKDAYITTETLDEVLPVIGEVRARKFFRETFEIKVDSKLIPEDSQQAVVDKLVGVMQEYGCAGALSAKSGFKPTSAFATERHRELTTEENLVLEGINGGKGLTVMSAAPARGRR